jgi:hypothetical protein
MCTVGCSEYDTRNKYSNTITGEAFLYELSERQIFSKHFVQTANSTLRVEVDWEA